MDRRRLSGWLPRFLLAATQAAAAFPDDWADAKQGRMLCAGETQH
jgi:hypothetical protein